MPRSAPEVLSGTRGPRSDRIEAMRAVEAADPNEVQVNVGLAAKAAKDGTLYLSKYPAYRVLVACAEDVVNPLTGRKKSGRPLNAVFKNGQYLNDSKDKTLRRMIDDALQNNSRFSEFGKGGDFWTADSQASAIKTKKLADAHATLSALPKEVVAEFLAGLQQGTAVDHALPEATPSS